MSPDTVPITLGQHLSFPPNVRISVTSEETPDDARHKRWRETVLFGAALLMFCAIFLVSLWFAFLTASADTDTRKSAVGIVITLTGALAGFLGGRATR